MSSWGIGVEHERGGWSMSLEKPYPDSQGGEPPAQGGNKVRKAFKET